ncbi:MAG TPA: carbohydrate kinase family protein [Mycobacteriales bacterium]|nr:carbohydrate kinase family protein [Mycobacteriales bacterium]
MRIAVTGSIATDYLMTFQGRFADQLLPDQLHRLSLSFLADDLDRRRGGVAANIAYGMAQLGLRPILVGAVGADWADYQAWLDRAGVDTEGVHVSELKHTARFFCTTDVDQCQIATFYPGAMTEARDVELAPIVKRVGGLDLVVVSPNDPEAMVRHTAEARSAGIPFVADPSQQLSSLDGPGIEGLVDGARFLITNDYEAALIESKTGWSSADVLSRVETRVTTLGAKGCIVERAGEAAIEVPVVPEERKADPTGVGDAFRAGFLAAQAWGLSLERSAQVGTLLATYVLETVGTQEYTVAPDAFLSRLASAYGDDAASDVRAHLSPR